MDHCNIPGRINIDADDLVDHRHIPARISVHFGDLDIILSIYIYGDIKIKYIQIPNIHTII